MTRPEPYTGIMGASLPSGRSGWAFYFRGRRLGPFIERNRAEEALQLAWREERRAAQ